MKINQDVLMKLDKVPKDTRHATSSTSNFGNVVKKQTEKLQTAALNNLISDIDSAGERVLRSRNFRDLHKYKSLVKKFLKEAVDYGMGINESKSMNQFGQTRTLKTIDLVDESLIKLAEDIMNKETESIDILATLGEIKGLLINLYT